MKTAKAYNMESRLVPILPEKKADKIPGGFYLKARCIQNSAIAGAPPHVREIWDWLIKEAKYKNVSFNGTSLMRGQLFTDYAEIQEGLSWKEGFVKKSYQKHHVDYAMRWLREKEMITTQKTTRGLFVTVCKYELYQNPTNYENANDYDTGKVTTPQTTPQTTVITTEEPFATTLFPIVCEEKKGNDYDSATDTANDTANDTVNKESKESKEERESTPPKWIYSHNGFFDKELEANKNEPEIEKYKLLIDFIHGMVGVDSIRLDNVLSLPKQISYKKYLTLRKTSQAFKIRTIQQVLESMESKKDLRKCYEDAFWVVNNWLKMDFDKK